MVHPHHAPHGSVGLICRDIFVERRNDLCKLPVGADMPRREKVHRVKPVLPHQLVVKLRLDLAVAHTAFPGVALHIGVAGTVQCKVADEPQRIGQRSILVVGRVHHAPGPGKEHPARLLVHGVAQPVHGVGLQCPVVEHQVRPVQAHIIQRPVWGDLFPQLPGQLHQNIRTKAAVCIRRWHILSPPFRTRISIAESHPRRHPSGSDLCKIFEIFFITPIP